MMKLFKYIYLLLVVALVGCSDPAVDGGYDITSGEEGSVALEFDIQSTKATEEDDAVDMDDVWLEHSVLKIYDSSNVLIRRYEPATEMPEKLLFVEGKYRATLAIGDKKNVVVSDVEDLAFYGESEEFVVKSGVTTNVALECTMLHTLVEVVCDDSLTDNLEEGYEMIISTTEVPSTTTSKSFTEDGEIYMLADDKIYWSFEGVLIDPEDDKVEYEVEKSGELEVKAGDGYTLTFSYKKYLVVDQDKILLDESTVDHDDHLSFSPQPTFKGVGFTLGEDQALSETDTIYVTSLNYLEDIKITSVGGEVIYALKEGAVTAETAVRYTKATNSEGKELENEGQLVINGSVFGDMSAPGRYDIEVEAVDNKNAFRKQTISAVTSGIGAIDVANDVDLWLNTAKIRLYSTDATVPEFTFDGVSVTPKKVTGHRYCYEATIAPEWNPTTKSYNGKDITYYTSTGGVWAGNTYDVKFGDYSSKSLSLSGRNTALASLNNSSLECYKNECGDSNNWASGNNSYSKYLCTYDSGWKGAKLKSDIVSVSIIITVNKFAAGNLVYGDFSMGSTSGTVKFGKTYNWTSRPRTINVKYKANVGGPLKDGDGKSSSRTVENGDGTTTKYTTDRARIYFAIVDWGNKHEVTAGTSSSTGMWDPERQTSTGEGAIIGYASYYIDKDVSSETQLEIPIHYYDTVTKPASSRYSLVVSCAASAYGDYMIGDEDSYLYVKDFEFGY